MLKRIFIISLFFIAPLTVTAVPIPASSSITSFSSSVDLNSAEVKFELNFTSTPDFFTTDSFGRQADSFQLFVNSDNLPVELSTFYRTVAGEVVRDDLTLVRGGEIHVNSDIRVREVVVNYDASTDPTSGGWGPLIGTKSYVLDDTQLTFTLPLSFLKDSDGLFYYYLETYSFGAWTGDTLFGISDFAFEVVSPVPEPSSIILILIGLTLIVVMRSLKICHFSTTSERHTLATS